MDNKNAIKQGAMKYLAMLLIQRIIGVVLFLVAAGTIFDMRGIVNFSLYFIVSIIACIVMYKGHQATLDERGKKHNNTQNWDKVLLPIYVLLAYYVIYFIAGFGVRFQWAHLSVEWMVAGVVIYIISGVFTVWPVVENKHFESTSRIQEDREQTVISTGPYRIVRHPGYMGIILWAIAITLIFGTLAVGITAGVIVFVITIRTYLEDSMLKRDLRGYLEYANKVKYRLLPFVW